MTTYTVEWTIIIEADTPEEAAREALRIQRTPDSTATCFSVYDDLGEGECACIDLTDIDDGAQS